MQDLETYLLGAGPAIWALLGVFGALLFAVLVLALARLMGGGSGAAVRELSLRMAEIAAAGERGRTDALRLMEDRLDAIERLSGQMLSLQEILANKQARGAFGEMQLADLLKDALPPNVVELQATLSNGRRVDALLRLPEPPGPMAVDAKFPLEAYEALRAAQRGEGAGAAEASKAAERQFRQAVKAHIAAIADRYLIPGETADGALMFVPSEGVYAEIHARLPEVVREGFAKRVWMVSPTTLMAVLVTLRGALRDLEIQKEAGDLRKEARLLAADVGRLFERSERLRGHLAQAETDLKEIAISAEKSLSRAKRIEEGGDA